MWRTHYATDVGPVAMGVPVRLVGWVEELRVLGKIAFLILRSRIGTSQVTLLKAKVDPGLFAAVRGPSEGSFVPTAPPHAAAPTLPGASPPPDTAAGGGIAPKALAIVSISFAIGPQFLWLIAFEGVALLQLGLAIPAIVTGAVGKEVAKGPGQGVWRGLAAAGYVIGVLTLGLILAMFMVVWMIWS